MEHYLIMAVFIFGMNTIPVLMPPTVLILAFFYVRYKLILWPVVLLGALAATSGRLLLAHLTNTYFRPFLSSKSKENLNLLGKKLNKQSQITIPLVITYAFLPFPSNVAFIAAGLSQVDLRLFAFCFFVGRLISYTFWVGTSRIVAHSLDTIFHRYYTKKEAIIFDILGLLLVYIITQVNWKELFKKIKI